MTFLQIDEQDRRLLTAAQNVRLRAYAPYSRFNVGAAVLADTGEIFVGCNVENASYGLAICAERVAVFSAIAHGVQRLKSIAVTTSANMDWAMETKMPCGACRQVMSEFLDDDGRIIVDGVGIFLLRDLLPNPFRLHPEGA